MARMLILYGTIEGQTTKIAHYIATIARQQGHMVDTIDSRTLPPDFTSAGFDAVMIGASVHGGAYPRDIQAFVRAHRDLLERVPSAFFSVSLSSASARAADQQDAEQCVTTFLQETGWKPAKIGTFAGALLYTQYGVIKRWLMKRIVKSAGGDTDTSRDYEYTDWDAVTRFTEDFLAAMR